MICGTCYGMLRGQRGRQWRGTYDVHFDHQKSWDALYLAARMGCCFCRVLWREAKSSDFKMSGDTAQNNAEDAPVTQAFLSEPTARRGLFRLEFRMGSSKRLATFFLQQSHDESESQIYTSMAEDTQSAEVLKLARHWIKTCTSPDHPTCPKENEFFGDDRRIYPTRLIELPPSNEKNENVPVRLIETKGRPIQHFFNYEEEPRGHYVTLSHCWGGNLDFTLNKGNQEQLKAGVPLSQFPLTFRQAINFARHLKEEIRYIWIDALCIVQDDVQDWNTESVKMYDVYRNSFCNISATAAKDGKFGMNYKRDPQNLWEDEINLNTNGIRDDMRDKTNVKLLGSEPIIQRCSIQDASFWNRLVEGAPVNLRAWVLQERLLAPRVLHFCEDQVVWECRHLEAAECLPLGISPLEVKSGDVVERQRLKWLIPQEWGTFPFAPDLFELSFVAHENWKRIVERYSTTGLTKDKDRLIALAGIAQLFSRQLGKHVAYVAGIWEKWLASQLLWRVDPHYYPKPRPAVYCAPSFSWASVKAGQAIICGETLKEDDLFISVKSFHVSLAFDTQSFGEVRPGGYLELEGTLHPIEILKRTFGNHDRYRWRLLEIDAHKELTGLHLDSLEHDGLDIRGPQARVFCMPAHKSPKGITCLILQLTATHEAMKRYRRIGLAVVPSYESAYATLTPRTAIDIAQDLKGPSAKKILELEKEVKKLQLENEALKAEKTRRDSGSASKAGPSTERSQQNEVPKAAVMTKIRLE